LRFSVRGFSPKRVAYLLNGVQLWLMYLVTTEAHYDAGAGIGCVSASVVAVNLLLGFVCPRNDPRRFFPCAIALLILIMTDMLTPL